MDPTAFQCQTNDLGKAALPECLEATGAVAPAAAQGDSAKHEVSSAPAATLIQRLVTGALWVVDVVLHLDQHLNNLAQSLGFWVYLMVFLVIFLETGVVIFPFLPGDSFLFALGALTAVEGAFLRLDLLIFLSFVAAVSGDALNYFIGKKLGPLIFTQTKLRFLNQQHLEKTQAFYERYGSKTIVIARFAPIVRTFAPFVAGIGSMSYKRFLTYNVVGGAAWILIFLVAGHYFGNLPAVKRNFHYVIFGIIFVSILPIFIEWWKTKTAKEIPSPSSESHLKKPTIF
ncbi:MAG: DedA family protein [Bdellovibrionales bacterium]|nr:DedA family protein [Bdellovibrionales bacterium]